MENRINVLKDIIVKSTEWLDHTEWTWVARYDDLMDASFGVQIAAAICLYHELHPEADTSAEGYQMAVYELIEDVLTQEMKGEGNT